MKFVERIIITLVRESKDPLDRKKILEDAAAIVKMEAIRCGKHKRALELWTQYEKCLAVAEELAAKMRTAS